MKLFSTSTLPQDNQAVPAIRTTEEGSVLLYPEGNENLPAIVFDGVQANAIANLLQLRKSIRRKVLHELEDAVASSVMQS